MTSAEVWRWMFRHHGRIEFIKNEDGREEYILSFKRSGKLLVFPQTVRTHDRIPDQVARYISGIANIHNME